MDKKKNYKGEKKWKETNKSRNVARFNQMDKR